MSLPWITGTPYSLYVRVRGIAPNGTPTGAWSTPFGFNIRWPSVPTAILELNQEDDSSST